MRSGAAPRRGDDELATAARAAVVAVIGWFFASALGGLQSPIGLALTFMLWLLTILAGVRAAVALTIGLYRRTH